MEETNRTFTDGEGEETMVAPRFDDEETVLARPVVPLEDVGGAHAPHASSATPLYSRLRATPRRSLVAALVLVSTLAGSVLGVAGLYFYQKHRSAEVPAAEQQQTADAPDTSAQATPAPATQASETSAKAAEPPNTTPAATPESDAKAENAADSAKEKVAEEAASAPAAERRNISESREPAAGPKHAKKGERDEEPQREERRARRDDERLSREDDSDGEQPEARRVGVITYRPRRVRTRHDNYGNADRLRRIFEGQP